MEHLSFRELCGLGNKQSRHVSFSEAHKILDCTVAPVLHITIVPSSALHRHLSILYV